MKQCIMSESRFDFLRELVKNVPDINIAEEQATADNSTSELGTITTAAATATTSTATSNTGASGGSTSNFRQENNGNCSFTNSPTITGSSAVLSNHRSNGNKRNFQVSLQLYPSTATTTIQSNANAGIATTATTITPQTSQAHNIHGPGFYKDHYTDQPTDKTSVIQYTPKLQTQKSIPNVDVRPPKLKRVDSAPAGANLYLNSPVAKMSTPPLSATLKMTTTNPSKRVPPLTPIKATSTATSATQMSTNQQSIRQSAFVYPSTSKDGTTSGVPTAPIVKIDVTNSTNPVVKIDYSNLSLPTHLYASASTSSSAATSAVPSASYQMPSTSASTTSASAASTTKSAAMINIDLLNNCATPSMAYKPITMTSTSTLEMDEDYDNI